jgi:hypothetical protein
MKRINFALLFGFPLIIFVAFFMCPILVSALPPIPPGIGIGGAIINSTTGLPEYNVNNPGQFGYQDQFGTPCLDDVVIQTGASTNSFYLDADFPGCQPLGGYKSIGSLGDISPLQTTIPSMQPTGHEIEIVSLSRTTPDAPISIAIEIFGYQFVGDSLKMTPSILDENDNILFQGLDALGNADGTGENGGPIYSFTLDSIPNDVISANVIRRLQILLVSVSGDVEQNLTVFYPFPLTYGCIELLHLGPAGFVSPSAVDVTFGCPGFLPPGNCEDSASAAIAVSRDYQKATRNVIRECVKKQTNYCESELQNQANVYEQLVEAQNQVGMYCP